MKRWTAAFPLALSLCAHHSAPAAAQSGFDGPYMPYAAFDRLEAAPVEVGGGVLRVAFAPGEFALPRERLLAWIRKSAEAVAAYYGRFPAASARVLIVPAAGRGVRGGQAFGHRGAAIRLFVGRESAGADLDRDWQAVHEMIHLATPQLHPRHLWLSEGISVYVESIARAMAGHRTEEQIWGEFMRAMPQGQPRPGDRGLDHTPTWGRTYWGGAIFCLLLDIDIRKKTGNAKGLQDGLRAILAAGGSNETGWPIAKALRVIDEATGGESASRLYDQMRASPAPADLEALWRDLGVSLSTRGAALDAAASLAPIRGAITAAN